MQLEQSRQPTNFDVTKMAVIPILWSYGSVALEVRSKPKLCRQLPLIDFRDLAL